MSGVANLTIPVRSRSASPYLEIEGLSIAFQRRGVDTEVVSRFDLSVERGSSVALVGESGSGKTVCMRAPFGLLPRSARISAERMRLDDVDLVTSSATSVRHMLGVKVGMVFQNPLHAFNPTVPIGRQLAEVLLWHKLCGRKEARERVENVLGDVGLPHPHKVMDSYPFELSGGMRQRAMIAMAIVGEPALLVADEPTTAIDASLQKQILDLLARQRERGMSVVLITHDLGVARYICDDIVVMYAGRVMERGSASRVLKEPAHPYTRGLLSSTLEIGRMDELMPIPGNPPEPGAWPAGCRFSDRCVEALPDRCGVDQVLRPLADGAVACWRSGS